MNEAACPQGSWNCFLSLGGIRDVFSIPRGSRRKLFAPADLLAARRAHVSLQELEALEDRHITRVIQKQQELGLGVFTDGELRRSNFMSDFTDAVDGFDPGDAVPRSWSDSAKKSTAPAVAVSSISGIVTSPLKQRQPLTGREVPFLQSTHPGRSRSLCPARPSFRQYRSSTALRTRSIGIPTHCSMQSRASWWRTLYPRGKRHLLLPDRCSALQLLP